MPEQTVLLLLRLLRVLQSFLDSVFLLEVGLGIDVVGKSHIFITNDVVCCGHLDEQISRVFTLITVRMILNTCTSESFLQVGLRSATCRNVQQLIVILGLLYTYGIFISEDAQKWRAAHLPAKMEVYTK